MDQPTWVQGQDGAVVVVVRAQPGAKRTAVVGSHGGALKIAVHAPPVDGKANEALQAALADWLGLPKRLVVLQAGTTSRDKRFVIAAPLVAVCTTLTARLSAP